MSKSVTTAPVSRYMHTVQTYTHIHIRTYIQIYSTDYKI